MRPRIQTTLYMTLIMGIMMSLYALFRSWMLVSGFHNPAANPLIPTYLFVGGENVLIIVSWLMLRMVQERDEQLADLNDELHELKKQLNNHINQKVK